MIYFDHKATFNCSAGSKYAHRIKKCSALVHVSAHSRVNTPCVSGKRPGAYLAAGRRLSGAPCWTSAVTATRLQLEVLLHCSVEDISDDSPLTTPSLPASRPQLKHRHSGRARPHSGREVLDFCSASLCRSFANLSFSETGAHFLAYLGPFPFMVFEGTCSGLHLIVLRFITHPPGQHGPARRNLVIFVSYFNLKWSTLI